MLAKFVYKCKEKNTLQVHKLLMLRRTFPENPDEILEKITQKKKFIVIFHQI